MTTPMRAGQKWEKSEIKRLLASLHKKKPLEEIAAEHQRTTTSIHSFRRKLAVDFYLKDKKSYEEIECLIGLSKEEIENAVKAFQEKGLSYKWAPKPITTDVSAKPAITADTTEIISILKEISCKLDIIIDRLGPASGAGDTCVDRIHLE